MSEAGGPREPYDYDEAVIGMLTLRINTPAGEWLSDTDLKIFGTYQQEAIEADGEEWGAEYMLLSMMNLAWYALINLATLTGESESVWLQRISLDLRDAPRGEGEA